MTPTRKPGPPHDLKKLLSRMRVSPNAGFIPSGLPDAPEAETSVRRHCHQLGEGAANPPAGRWLALITVLITALGLLGAIDTSEENRKPVGTSQGLVEAQQTVQVGEIDPLAEPLQEANETQCPQLFPGERIQRDLARGTSHCYQLRLEGGDLALILAEQLSNWIPNNLLVRRIGPAGDTVAQKTNRQLVPEIVRFVAPQTGVYRFEVTRIEHRQGLDDGPYRIWLEALLDPEGQRNRERALAEDPRVAWLNEQMVPPRSLDPYDEDFSDLMPMAESLRGVQVVALGEPTHGSGGAFWAKTRVLKFLHQVMGFDVLAWESSVYAMRKADQHLRSGESAREALDRGVFGFWLDSDQMQPLVDYLDRTARDGHPLELAGFDFQFSGTAPGASFIEDLKRYLDNLEVSAPELAPGGPVEEVLEAVIKHLYEAGIRTLPDSSKRGSVLAALEDWEKEAGRDASSEGAFWAGQLRNTRLFVENLLQRMDLSTRGNATRQERLRVSAVRDRVMAQNLVWLADELYPGRKIVVWAATGHVLKQPSGIAYARVADGHPAYGDGLRLPTTMGHEAWLELGDRMYVLAVTAHGGLHGSDTWIGYPNNLERDQVDEFEMEELFTAVGHEHGFLDLRGLRGQEGALSRPLIARGIDGYIPWRAIWPESVDGLMFMRQMTPSTTGGTLGAQRPSSH